MVRMRGCQPLIAALADAALLPHPQRPLQPFLTPQSLRAFTVGHQTVGVAEGVRFAPSPTRMLARDLSQLLPKDLLGLVDASPTALDRPRLTHHSTCSAFGYPEPFPQYFHGPAAAVRAYQFPRFNSLSMSRSKA